MVILQLQRMFYDTTLPFLILYACLSALLFFWMQSMACYLTDLRARYSGQVFVLSSLSS